MNEETSRKSAIKQERKERKQFKKEAKRLEQQKEHVNIKLEPKDHRVRIISKDTPESNATSNFNIKSPDLYFPSLEEASNYKIKSIKNENTLPQSSDTEEKPSISTKRKKSTPILLDIKEMLSTSSISKVSNQTKHENPSKFVSYGNILDSSQPQRLRGKRREIPRRKPPSKLKSQIISDSKKFNSIKSNYNGIHSPEFETYCDHVITEDLNLKVKDFLSDIVRFQENLFKRDSIKGIAKRRYIIGLREVKKFIIIKKIKLIIIAPNIRTIVENGALDTAVQDLISLAKENEIPYLFALSRWKLGETTLKFRPISCVGIFEYSGAEEKYKEIINLLEEARHTYLKLIPVKSNSENEFNTELINKLINKCI